VDAGDSAAIELFDYAHEARLAHLLGLSRLLQQALSRPVKQLRKQLLRGNENQLVLAAAGLEREALLEDLLAAIVLDASGLRDVDCRRESEFNSAVERGNRLLVSVAQEMEQVIINTLKPLASLKPLLSRQAATWPAAAGDIGQQLEDLLRPGFLIETPRAGFAQFPRYMKAVAVRVERLAAQPQKDAQCQALLEALQEPLAQARQRYPGLLLRSEEAARYWQMLQEFRVSLFAQHLGTAQPVSEKRLKRQWWQVEEVLGRWN